MRKKIKTFRPPQSRRNRIRCPKCGSHHTRPNSELDFMVTCQQCGYTW